MVDIHCHILPGIDDGPTTWEITAEMCRLAAEDGITHIVATPHCNQEYSYDRGRFTEMLGDLHDAGLGKLTFSLGCDLHLTSENVADAMARPRQYAIGDSQYLLVELSNLNVPRSLQEDLLGLRSCGLVPILTHPERNRTIQGRTEIVLELIGQGCLVQLTASAVTGFWGDGARKVAEWLLKREAVHVIASDGHDSLRRRPVMSAGRAAVEKLVGVEVAERLFVHNPTAIINGGELSRVPASF